MQSSRRKSAINQRFLTRITILSDSQNNSEMVSLIPTPCNFADFYARGADGLLFGIPQRFRPAPGAAPARPPPRRFTPESQSILVLRGVILVSSLDAVVTVAEALPVALIPEENTVSSVRLDVIHIGRLDVAPLLQALHTQRMRLKVTLAGFVPCRAVAAAAC